MRTRRRGPHDRQMSFFDERRHEKTSPKPPADLQPTSRMAAKVAAPHVEQDLQRIVALLTARSDGLTYDAISEALNIPLQTVCWRMKDLRDLGRIAKSGQRAKTRSGASAVVWILIKEV